MVASTFMDAMGHHTLIVSLTNVPIIHPQPLTTSKVHHRYKYCYGTLSRRVLGRKKQLRSALLARLRSLLIRCNARHLLLYVTFLVLSDKVMDIQAHQPNSPYHS